MDRNAFHQLLKRYVDGNCTAEENALIHQWYQLLDDVTLVAPGGIEMLDLESRMWNNIKDSIALPNFEAKVEKTISIKSRRSIVLKWASAAAVLIICVGGILMYSSSKNSLSSSLITSKVAEGLLQETNTTNTAKKILLEDGSMVILQPLTKVAYPKHFLKSKREVYLEGDAFFEVTKNQERPFFVYNGRLVTQVLGTSFNVKLINNKIEVAVRTGRVSVYEDNRVMSFNEQQKKNNGVIITPNQKVTYYTESRHFITSLVDDPILVPPLENKKISEPKFAFDDTPLYEVLEVLEKNYDIEIVLANKDLANCPLTGDISKQSLFNKMEFICQAFQATYEVRGTKILLSGGKACF